MNSFELVKWIYNHPMNQRKQSAAIARFIRWQIASRLMTGSLIEVPFCERLHIFMRNGMTGATGNFYCGLHEPNEMGFLLHFLRDSDIFFDVGANIGSYTLLASGEVGAKSVCFEPISSTFDSLCNNVLLNRLQSYVEMRKVAVGEEAGLLLFTNDADTMNHAATSTHNGSVETVEVITLDSEAERISPTFIKVDVEGFESAVLRGGHQTFANERLRAAIIETNGSGGKFDRSDDEIYLAMQNFGFRQIAYDARTRTIDLTPIKSNSNAIFVRDPLEADTRTRAARTFHLFNGMRI